MTVRAERGDVRAINVSALEPRDPRLLLLVAVAFAPLALGSTYDWSILGLRLLVALALGLAVVAGVARGSWRWPHLLIAGALLAYLATVVVSAVVSPYPHGSWQETPLIVKHGLGFCLVTSAAGWGRTACCRRRGDGHRGADQRERVSRSDVTPELPIDPDDVPLVVVALGALKIPTRSSKVGHAFVSASLASDPVHILSSDPGGTLTH